MPPIRLTTFDRVRCGRSGAVAAIHSMLGHAVRRCASTVGDRQPGIDVTLFRFVVLLPGGRDDQRRQP